MIPLYVEKLPYEELENHYKSIRNLNKKYFKKIERLNNIIDKAIEYIQTFCDDKARVRNDISGKEIDKLIEILEGSDKE